MLRKAISCVASGALAFTMVIAPGQALAADEGYTAPSADSLTGKTAIICTGNIRGDIDQFAKVATLSSDYETAGATVILADVGNFYQGSKYASYDGGETVVKAMREVGYDIVVPGKNDFSFGTNDFGNPYSHANHHWTFKALTPSLKDTATMSVDGEGAPVAGTAITGVSSTVKGSNEYYDFEASATVAGAGSLLVTFSGMTDAAAADIALTGAVDGLTFDEGAAAVQDATAALGASGVNVVLSNLPEVPEVSAATQVVNIAPVAYGQAPAAKALVLNADGTVSSSEDIDLSGVTAASSVKTLVDSFKATVDTAFPDDLTAVNMAWLDGSQTKVRFQETPVGNLFADAIRWFALNDDDLKADLAAKGVAADHVIGTINGGNLRDNLYEGQVTERDFDRIECFPNNVSIIYVKGSDLLTQFEMNAYGVGSPSEQPDAAVAASFNQVSDGVVYNIDTTKEFDKGDAVGSRWYEAKTVNRVSFISINGKALVPEDTYAVATSDKIANGMDSNSIFSTNKIDRTDSSTSVCVAAVKYIKGELEGTIAADSKYTAAQGRVTFNEVKPATPDTPSQPDATKPADSQDSSSTQPQTTAKKATAITVNAKTVSAKAVKAAAKKAGTDVKTIKTVTLGAKVKKIAAKAFKGTAVTKLVVKTTKLKKAGVKNCLKGSKVKTVQVKVAKKSLKKTKKAYKKIFTKQIAGKKATVK